jgi:hypothetical protein
LRERCPDARLFYSYILDDNTASRRLFESEGFTAHPQRLLYHAVLPLLFARRPPAGLSRLDAEAVAIDRAIAEGYDFREGTAGHDAIFLLQRGAGRAWTAIRRHGPQVIVGMPWCGAWLSRLLPLLPALGRPFRVWSLHHLGATGPNQHAALQRLVAGVAYLGARGGADALVLPLFENDPRSADLLSLTLTRWGVTPGVTHLYVAGDRAEALLASRRPLLMSGKDG